MYGYIYLTTNNINGKLYVGQHKYKKFMKSYKGSGRTLIKAFNKHGKENFSVIPIHYCYCKNMLNYWEDYYIKQYKTREREIGYNKCAGGVGVRDVVAYNKGKKCPEISLGKTGKPGRKHTEDEKKHQSQLMIGNNYGSNNRKNPILVTLFTITDFTPEERKRRSEQCAKNNRERCRKKFLN